MKVQEWSQHFPHYNPMGAIFAMEIWPKTYCSLPPTPIMLKMNFDFDRPAGLRDIHVW